MTKEKFLKELKSNLKYLPQQARKEELDKYKDLTNYNDLDPIKIANEIYQEKGINAKIYPKIKFLDATNILITNLQSQDKNIIKDILIFFLTTFLLIILIKIPFIYVRDMITNLFNDTFKNDNTYTLWALFIEVFYALTAILIFIKKIKTKAQTLKKDTK